MKPVIHKSERATANLTLREATGRDGIRRAGLARQALRLYADDPATWFMAYHFHPACVSCVDIGFLKVGKKKYTPDTIVDMPFDEFIDLPEALINAWTAAAYELNPHWQPEINLTDEQKAALAGEKEKKTDPSSAG